MGTGAADRRRLKRLAWLENLRARPGRPTPGEAAHPPEAAGLILSPAPRTASACRSRAIGAMRIGELRLAGEECEGAAGQSRDCL